MINAGINRARSLVREEEVQEKIKDDDKFSTPKLIVEYDPRTTPTFQGILEQNYQGMLDMDSRMKKVFHKCPQVVNKRGKNMKEMLCRAKLPPKLGTMRTRSTASTMRAGFRWCGKSRCPMCPFTGEAADGRKVVKEVTISSTETIFPLQHSMTCQTSNCIYLLTCSKDGKQYVWETGRTVAKRFMSTGRACTSKPPTIQWASTIRRLVTGLKQMLAVMLPIIQLKTNNVWVTKAMERKFINEHDMIES